MDMLSTAPSFLEDIYPLFDAIFIALLFVNEY